MASVVPGQTSFMLLEYLNINKSKQSSNSISNMTSQLKANLYNKITTSPNRSRSSRRSYRSSRRSSRSSRSSRKSNSVKQEQKHLKNQLNEIANKANNATKRNILLLLVYIYIL
jgi:hypothetical protein